MKRQLRLHHLLPIFLIFLLLISLPVSAADTSGTLATGQVWNFESATGVLTVTGAGELPDYTEHNTCPPWDAVKTDVKIIVLSDGITRIGNYSFAGMINLSTVTLPSTLTYIGDEAFRYASQLKAITIPAGVTVLGDSAFADCANLSTVSLNAGLLEIGSNAFARCPKIASFTIPNTVTRIGSCAFLRCSQLTSITIPKSVTTVGDSAFIASGLQKCTFLGSPKLGAGIFGSISWHTPGDLQLIRFCADAPDFAENSLSSVDAECIYPTGNATWKSDSLQNYGGLIQWFASADPANAERSTSDIAKSGSCGNSATWALQNGVLTISGTGQMTQIGWSRYRQDIQKVIVNDGITEIVWLAFSECPNLTQATIADSVTVMKSSVFNQCPKLTSVKLSSNITTIPQNAFSGCTSLTAIDIPSGVTSIVQDAFNASGLVKVVLPDALVSIGTGAFQACTSLEEITFPKNLTQLNDYAFAGCTSLKKIFVYCKPIRGYLYTFEKVVATAYYPEENKIWATQGGFGSGSISIRPMSYLEENYCEGEHNYGDWVVTVEPTPDVFVGWKERVCSTCGYKQTVAIPVDENATRPPATTAPPATTPPVTAPSTQPDTDSSAPPATVPASTPATEPDASQSAQPNASQPAQPNTSQPSASAPASVDPSSSQNTNAAKKSDPTILIICIISGIALAGGGAVWYFLRKKK